MLEKKKVKKPIKYEKLKVRANYPNLSLGVLKL